MANPHFIIGNRHELDGWDDGSDAVSDPARTEFHIQLYSREPMGHLLVACPCRLPVR